MSILNNALSGALASQLALSSSSQNIANLQTKGYTRQQALLGAVGPSVGSTQAGNGVRVSSLIRFSDDYKTQQLWRAAASLGEHSQTQPYLTQLEQVMGDDQTSLSSGVDQFFAALNAVAGVDPTSTPLRQQVVTMAGLLSQRFNSMNNVFDAQMTSVDQQRTAIVNSANNSIDTIAALNTRIASAHAVGTNVSSLMDQRDQAIDSLASLVGLEISDQPDGTRNVSLKTGQALVMGGIAGELKAEPDPLQPKEQVFSLTFAGSTFKNLDVTGVGGQLGGLTTYKTQTLEPKQKEVIKLAQEIAGRVNGQLQKGYTMDGKAGTDLFVYDPTDPLSIPQVVEGFAPGALAFAGPNATGGPGAPGDTTNLQLLLDIKNQALDPSDSSLGLIGDADTQLVGTLAVKSQQNKASLETAQTLRDQAMTDWQSTSGVNQDEEAINLVEYQNMYQANMKVMSVANALFDATLAMMG